MRVHDAAQIGDCDCSDPAAELSRLFVEETQRRRMAAGQRPVRRAVFLKPHGCAFGRFEVLPDLDPALRVGVFGGSSFPAWVRFSSDTLPGSSDLDTTVGVGIKLFGVPGTKLLEPAALTQDFVLQNFDVFLVDDAREMCELTCAGVRKHDYGTHLRRHPRTAAILDAMAQPVSSVLGVAFWSVPPSAFARDS